MCVACNGMISLPKLWIYPRNIELNFPWSYVPLADLRLTEAQRQRPGGGATAHPFVDSARKERYLSPEELRVAFRQEGVESLQEFYAMPRWKQKRAKIRAGLWHDQEVEGGEGEGEGEGDAPQP